MGTAKLKYIIDLGNNTYEEINLLSKSLRDIDDYTRYFKNAKQMENGDFYDQIAYQMKRTNGKSGRFALFYIENNDRTEELDILYDDPRYIQTGFSIYDFSDTENEFERARKLLWSSNNKMFIKKFLNDETLLDTLTKYIPIKNIKEYQLLKKRNIKIVNHNGINTVSTLDLFKHYAESEKSRGNIAELLEQTLEIWKRDLNKLPSDTKYYYARSLRHLINDYEKKCTKTFIKENNPKPVSHLNIGNIKNKNYYLTENGKEGNISLVSPKVFEKTMMEA